MSRPEGAALGQGARHVDDVDADDLIPKGGIYLYVFLLFSFLMSTCQRRQHTKEMPGFAALFAALVANVDDGTPICVPPPPWPSAPLEQNLI